MRDALLAVCGVVLLLAVIDFGLLSVLRDLLRRKDQ